ncbi:LIM domain transcription factor LMO4 [Fasciola hepatica]|uniref:LIM domain transcription factor LMO4 n=1 Tax=Fasciola hepatica TaxID=6192 RepID=A0A4E0RDM6_FASHE|nr:LIM domain transcription factor LMO4 [Fasciola hepatica]
MAIVCAACGCPIMDRTLLSVLDRFWHTACLNCSCCGLRLDELGPSVFVRENMLLCRQDYLRLFGLSGTCAKCRQKIPPDELVMRCQEHVYHVNCFVCVQCHTPLHPGDKVCVINGNLFCEHEFSNIFSSHCLSPGISVTNMKNSRLTMHPAGSMQSDLVRGLVVQKSLNNGASMNAVVGNRPSMINSGMLRSSPGHIQQLGPGFVDGSQPAGMDVPYSILPITQSELAMVINNDRNNNSHPSSPNFPYISGPPVTTTTATVTMVNQNFTERSPSSGPGLSFSDPDSGSFNGVTDPITLVSSMSTEKSIKISGTTGTQSSSSSSDAPTGRKKQKKVDSRRCPPLRVC